MADEPVHVNEFCCPKCKAVVGTIEADGSRLKLSDRAALYNRTRIACLGCRFQFYWNPEKGGKDNQTLPNGFAIQ